MCSKQSMNNLGQNVETLNKWCKYQSVYTRDISNNVYHKIPKIQANVYKTFYNGYGMHNTSQTWYITQEWELTMKVRVTCILLSQSTKPSQPNSQK